MREGKRKGVVIFKWKLKLEKVYLRPRGRMRSQIKEKHTQTRTGLGEDKRKDVATVKGILR